MENEIENSKQMIEDTFWKEYADQLINTLSPETKEHLLFNPEDYEKIGRWICQDRHDKFYEGFVFG